MKRGEKAMGMDGWIAGLLLLAGCGQGGADSAAWPAALMLPDVQESATAAAPVVAPKAEEVRAVETAGLLPPGARAVPASRVEGAVAFAYRTPAAPAEVIGWYRASRGLSLQSEMDEGGEHVLSGTIARPAGDFSVRLAADRGGGTTAMVLVTPRQR